METSNIKVAVVIENGIVRIYGPIEANGVRPFVTELQFANRGQALHYAREFDDKQRKK